MNDNHKDQLAESVKRHADLAQSRFDSAHSPMMAAAWGTAGTAKAPAREGKSDGKKFWLPERDDRLIDDLQRRAALLGLLSNRSQIVRASVHLFSTLDDGRFFDLVDEEIAKDSGRGVKG